MRRCGNAATRRCCDVAMLRCCDAGAGGGQRRQQARTVGITSIASFASQSVSQHRPHRTAPRLARHSRLLTSGYWIPRVASLVVGESKMQLSQGLSARRCFSLAVAQGKKKRRENNRREKKVRKIKERKFLLCAPVLVHRPCFVSVVGQLTSLCD